MSEDRFEQDLRTVVRSLAPDEVPVAVRKRVAGVTAEGPGRTPWIGRRWRFAAALSAAAVIVVGAAVIVFVPRLAGPTASGAASSAAVGSFVQQTDGKFGYEIIRPAGWTAHDGHGLGRVYSDTEDARQAWLLLSVNNLAITSEPGDGNVDAWVFRNNSSLDGWTTLLEQGWRHDARPFTLIQRLPNAKVYYASALPDGSQTYLVAYVVDASQPLIVGLGGGAPQSFEFEPLDRLRADGLLGDFITMVESVRAIPEDPTNVSPPLNESVNS